MVYEFDFSRSDATAILALVGPLDLLSASEVRGRVHRVVAEGWTRLVIDLSGVDNIDTTGLGALVHALRVARGAGGDVRIANPPDLVRRLLKTSTLDRVLRPYPTVEAALAEYAAA